MIAAVQAVMSAATLAYALGYWLRHRDNLWHRRLMALGFVFTLAIAVVLVAGVHLYGATYGPADWLVQALGGDRPARVVLIVHRGLATLTFLLLAAQVYTGWRRLPLHHRLHRAVVPLWLLSYVSGMFIFQ
jgi:uncharacterized membrane protein YozB (DUF420 family)